MKEINVPKSKGIPNLLQNTPCLYHPTIEWTLLQKVNAKHHLANSFIHKFHTLDIITNTSAVENLTMGVDCQLAAAASIATAIADGFEKSGITIRIK